MTSVPKDGQVGIGWLHQTRCLLAHPHWALLGLNSRDHNSQHCAGCGITSYKLQVCVCGGGGRDNVYNVIKMVHLPRGCSKGSSRNNLHPFKWLLAVYTIHGPHTLDFFGEGFWRRTTPQLERATVPVDQVSFVTPNSHPSQGRLA